MTAQAIFQAKQQLKSVISPYLDAEQVSRVMDASDFADVAHTGITRKSGEPYILHPIAVTEILAKLKLDADTLVAALLHDVIEDTPVEKAEISQRYGDVVAHLVDGVTKLTSSGDKHYIKAASLRKFLRAVLQDPRVVVIKLSDRYHNMSTLGALRLDKRQRIAKETAEVYVPMARLLGMNEMADLLEDLCYFHLDPDVYHTVKDALQQHQAEREEYQVIWANRLENALQTLHIQGKMQAKDNTTDLLRAFFKNEISLHQLSHSHAYSVILPTIQDCEDLVDLLQQRYTVLDYKNHIRNPMAGGTQVIILELKGPKTYLSLYIQTELMSETARFGVLLGDNITQVSRSAIQSSLHNLHELIDDDSAKTTFTDLLNYLHREKIHVYTPKGDAYELARGASAVDFAYATSTNLGNLAVSCKINGEEMPLCTILENRQTVEIITDPAAKPNPEWLSCIATPKARRNIIARLRLETHADQVHVGQQALNRALKVFDSALDMLTEQQWQDILQWRNCENKEDIFTSIAVGDLLPQLLVNKLFNAHSMSLSPIANTDGVDIKYAPCCHPVKGDVIVGNTTKRGLVIHRFKCKNIQQEQRINPENIVQLHWHEETAQEMRFNAHFKIDSILDDEQSTQAIHLIKKANAGVNTIQFDKNATYISTVVRDRQHVAQIIRELRILLDFPKIKRLYELPEWFNS